MRKLDATMPLASPEWMPSETVDTRRSPVTLPRSDVQSHMRS